VASVATEATETARKIVRLGEETKGAIMARLGRRSGNGLRLLDHLFNDPVVTVRSVENALGISQPAAAALITQMEGAGILNEMTGRRRDRVFRFAKYLELFGEREQRA
jgi:Fic family protein